MRSRRNAPHCSRSPRPKGKPEQAWPKIVEGRLNSWFGERVLLEQGVLR